MLGIILLIAAIFWAFSICQNLGLLSYLFPSISINISALWVNNVTLIFPMKTVKYSEPKRFARATNIDQCLRWWLNTDYSITELPDIRTLGFYLHCEAQYPYNLFTKIYLRIPFSKIIKFIKIQFCSLYKQQNFSKEGNLRRE